MPYTKQQVTELSGLPDRTLRNYQKRGLLPATDGYGLGASYSDDYAVRAVTIGRMRAQGDAIDVITERISGWTTAAFRRFVRQTDPAPPPQPPPAAPPAAAPAEAPAVDGEPVSRAEERLRRHEPIGELALPDGPSFRVLPLLPGLGLMVDMRAAPVVHRIAAEIYERYANR